MRIMHLIGLLRKPPRSAVYVICLGIFPARCVIGSILQALAKSQSKKAGDNDSHLTYLLRDFTIVNCLISLPKVDT